MPRACPESRGRPQQAGSSPRHGERNTPRRGRKPSCRSRADPPGRVLRGARVARGRTGRRRNGVARAASAALERPETDELERPVDADAKPAVAVEEEGKPE